ncbi:FtsQ-type POTRA domain-containing protein [Cryobacterium sp. CG_9.6]|uniref:FtsQ-type POTRA domain-containing protein n=1 Tax=Cryobacterium sp. CG_9.6 TaxID=2760710 RepID=UPI0024740EBD|nr:FtsQ-type POTRA domain-containing protein [Cryobacterium sp. CG_9.6]MDH6237219.1 cell division protein FtsQ [Cryobacterium sp. CG_9.6]
MKRPGGFDRPSTPSTPSSKKATGPAGRTVGTSAPQDARTEPITVPADALAPVSRIRSLTGSSVEKSGVAVAGAVLRGARRARKRFERAEVRRFTWRSRRRRTAWLVALGSIVLLLGGVIAAAYSPLMALRTIDVVGANRVAADRVVDALGEQLGTPLPLIDFTRVKSELATFTLIESYVTESRPPGTLVVRIVEREPIGVIPSSSGFDLVDAAGVRIESSAERPAGFPQIDAPDGVGSAGFLAAGEVIHALPDSIRGELDSVAAVTTDDVTLTLTGGARVAWGSAEQSELKAVVLGALMVGHPVGSVNEYDVSSPNSAVIR